MASGRHSRAAAHKAVGLFVGGSLILGGIIGEVSANKMRKTFAQIEKRELAEQIKKEEG